LAILLALGARDLCSNHGRPNTKEKKVPRRGALTNSFRFFVVVFGSPSLFMGCESNYLTKMEPMIILFIIALTVILFVYLFFNTFKRFIINSAVGIALIFLLNLVFGLNMALNWFTIAAVTLFGLPAVGTILILYLGGMLQ
jgi:hypothetical protein